VKLKAWLFRAEAPKRGTVIYLHGSADNRASGIGIAEHFVPLGFDFLAYDSRAHGESGGDMCTYGFYEKHDLSRVIDRVESPPVVLLGSSLGAAVALQTAAEDDRIAVVVGVATFSDLRTVAGERAPFFASRRNIEEAIKLAEDAGKFRFDEVSPAAAAPKIRAPVLLVHGEKDQETPPAHSQRVYDALRSPRRLILVPNAAHNNALTPEVWRQIDDWIFAALAKAKEPADK
jgi:pimeloyl-ACP methyl ester carboxylesterase